MKNVRVRRALYLGCLPCTLLVVLVISAKSANAQTDFASCVVRPFDPLCQVMGPVYRQRAEIKARGAVERRIREAEAVADLYGLRDYAGQAIAPAIIGATGGYRDYGQQVNRRMSRTQGAILGGSLGANVVGIITGERKWMAVGAGGGAAIGALLAGRGSDGKPVNCSKRKLNRREQETCAAIVAEQQAIAEQQAAQTELAERQRTAKRIYNHTGFSIDIFDGDRLIANLRLNQTVTLPEAREGYRAEMLIPDRIPGRTVRVEADFRLANDRSGWVFTAPNRGGV